MRILAVSGNTFREAIRMRLVVLLAVSGIASLAGGLYFQEFNLGSSELRFIADFGFGAMSLFGSIVAIVVTVQLLYSEFETRTALPILSNPIRRWEFLAGKMLGSWATICSFIAILALALVAALWIREHQLSQAGVLEFEEGSVDYAGVLIVASLQCARLVILASIAGFFCSYASSSMFAVFMSFFVWMIGQLKSALVQGFQQDSESGFSFSDLISLLIPDLRLFDYGHLAFTGNSEPTLGYLNLVFYAGIYVSLYVGLAMWVLSKREI